MQESLFRRIIRRTKQSYSKRSIRYTVFLAFTLSAALAITLTGVALYLRLSGQLEDTILKENQIVISQVNQTLESYLRDKMRLSDSLYYSVIKNADLEEEDITERMSLLYNASQSSIENIALFSAEGELLATAPPAVLKKNADPIHEEWFQKTLDKSEDLHFSSPSVQTAFSNADDLYRWVVSLSCAVEITQGKSTSQGVLLIDLKYSGLEQILNKATLGNDGYIYLINSEGDLIYHPKQQLIASGQRSEDNRQAASLEDGNHKLSFEGEERILTVKTVGYTGWKLVGVTPQRGLSFNSTENRVFIVGACLLFLLGLVIMNSYISSTLTDPIQRLERSVRKLEELGIDTEIYVGGSYEIRHLGWSVQRMVDRMRQLMDEAVAEHESKRKSELNALQAQINPHFLYNTLDIIVWMIENENYTDAVSAVTALARLFRISLSKGKVMIPVQDELEHIRNYLTIQKMRYKNKFTYEIEAEEEALSMATIKLVVQPLVENAIYHGMEFMDGDGLIRIRAWVEGSDLYLSVQDNGLGMTPDRVEKLRKGILGSSRSRGSGIGVANVNERIKLYFGSQYGLEIESEPDEGTTITIHLEAVVYEEGDVRWEK